MKRIWRLKNSGGLSSMVVAEKVSIERLALHFKVVKDLTYSDITEVWEQYFKAPEGVASVEMDMSSFTWMVYDEKGKMWKGTKGKFQ